MAIIKTGSTADLMEVVLWNIFQSFYGAQDIAIAADYLASEVGSISPNIYDYSESTNEQGLHTNELVIGSDSVVCTQTTRRDPLMMDTKWGDAAFDIYQFSFFGQNLDGVGGDSLATRVKYSYDKLSKLDTAGASRLITGTDRYDGEIDYDIYSATFRVTKATVVESAKRSYYGYLDDPLLSGDGLVISETRVQSFLGDAHYSTSGSGTLIRSTVYSYSKNTASTLLDSGSFERAAQKISDAAQFKLQSAAGMGFLLDPVAGYVVDGSIDSIFYSSAHFEQVGLGAAQASVDYFKYVNTASPLDDIEMQYIANYIMGAPVSNLEWEKHMLRGDDIITVTDPNGSVIDGWAGNDKVIGGSGNDLIYGGAGNDVLTGGAGMDLISGGTGDDIVKGGAHDDQLSGFDGRDFLDGGSGNDTVAGGSGNDWLLGGAGADWLGGGADDDYLDGGAGSDTLWGDVGNDTLKGAAGNDVLQGEAGNDYLDGGAGNDLLIGGAGRDLMTGGTGIDGFYFATGHSGDAALSLASLDQIKGFNVAQDQILFAFACGEADIKVLDAGASYEALLAAAKAQSERVVVGYAGANTYVFVDTNDDSTLDLAIELLGIKGASVANGLSFDTYIYTE